MNSQPFFTSTKEQFKDTRWKPNQAIGLGYGEAVFLPMARTGVVIGKGAKEISPIIIQSGKRGIQKADKFYDDVTLGVINKANNVAPNLTNRYILDPTNSLKIIGGVEVANDVFNDSSPIPSTPRGTILSGVKNIDEFLKNENNDIKNLFINNNLIRKKENE